MKRTVVILLSIFALTALSALDLVFIPTESIEETKAIFADSSIIVHHYRDEFVIAGSNHKNLPKNWKRIKSDVDLEQEKIYILYFLEEEKADYLKQVRQFANILYEANYFVIIEHLQEHYGNLIPQIHGGVVRIFPQQAKLPKTRSFPKKRETNPLIEEMLNQVDVDELINSVQHLEDYQTRKWDTSQAIQAQNWIDNKFSEAGLPVELVPVPQGTQYAHNVIATQTGLVYPDEYIALGAHYDSISNYGSAPGADDNATGTASILEIARVLSNYQFERSIIYCTFSAEEIGLYGSQAYVQHALANEMEILGYFNIDMAGYLHDGFEPHTHIIAPASAQPLVDYYIEMVNLYLPGFSATQENFIYGDSDHTSFNNAGIMGIFPFENVNYYSPYIHSPNDIFGLSVNHVEQHALFTQATMASVANLAAPLHLELELAVEPQDESVFLSWNEIEQAVQYLIYRDGEIVSVAVDGFFSDSNLVNGHFFAYQVEALAGDGQTVLATSGSVSVMPAAALPFPYQNSITGEVGNMVFEADWGLCDWESYTGDYSIADSPGGEYQNSQETSFYLSGINLNETESAFVQFFVKYELAANDTVFVEFSENPGAWVTLDIFTGEHSTWHGKAYSLDDFLNQSNQLLRFRMKTDDSETGAGIYLDDFSITPELTSGENTVLEAAMQLRAYPNPFNPATTIEFSLPKTAAVELSIYNIKGEKVKTLLSNQSFAAGNHQIIWNGKNDNQNHVSSGVYLYRLQAGTLQKTQKMILLK